MPNNMFARPRDSSNMACLNVLLYTELQWTTCSNSCGGMSTAEAKFCENPDDPTEDYTCENYVASCLTEACDGKSDALQRRAMVSLMPYRGVRW